MLPPTRVVESLLATSGNRPRSSKMTQSTEQARPVVETAFELIPEQRSQALAVAHPFDHAHRQPHALRREVDAQRIGVGRRGVGQVAVAEHGGGHGMIERRGMDVAEVAVVDPQRSLTGLLEDRLQLGRELDGLQHAVVGTQVLDPGVGAEVAATPPAGGTGVVAAGGRAQRAHHLELDVHQAEPPGVEPIGAQVDVFGEGPLESGGRRLLQSLDRRHLGVEVGVARGQHGGDVLTDAELRVAGDHRLAGVEVLPWAAGVELGVLDVDELRLASRCRAPGWRRAGRPRDGTGCRS